ncbi:MAG TPA: hypothetical protein VIJ14_04900, partial [Rhabdochlamydiaceae bacterium]
VPWNKRIDNPIGTVRKGSRRERKYEDRALTDEGKKTVRDTGKKNAFIADLDPWGDSDCSSTFSDSTCNSDRQIGNATFMAEIDSPSDDVVERAIQALMLQRDSQSESQVIHIPSVASPAQTSDIDASHDSVQEVNSNSKFKSISMEEDSSSSDESEIELEFDSHESLMREVNRLRQSEIEKEGMILTLKAKVSSFEISVKSYKAQITEFNGFSKCECQALKGETSSLKVEIQNLKFVNESLKSACVSLTPSTPSLDKVLEGQNPNDKTGLGFKKTNGHKHVSSKSQDQKGKWEYNTNTNRGNAFMYRDSNKGKSAKNDQHKNVRNYDRVDHYAPHSSYRHNHAERTKCVYKWGSNGYFYKVSSPHVANHQKRTPKHFTNTQRFNKSNNSCAKTTKPITKRKEYYNHLQSHFVKSSEITNKPSRAFCNYCCNVGHISTGCPLRKPQTNSNWLWLRKDRNMASTSTSNGVCPKV